MTYIFLVAGRGTRLHPLTLSHPKSLYKLDSDTTVLQRMVSLIKKHDKTAEIVVVTGFMHSTIESELSDVTFVFNPFYDVTNSIASLWFAREYLKRTQVTIINGDIVMEDKLVKDVICSETDKPIVLMDSSIKSDGDYNVQINDDKIVVMSKELTEYSGEYAGVSKFDAKSALALYQTMNEMIEEGIKDQWYENVLVQMIFRNNFELYYQDICDYSWTEVDSVGDFVYAKKIHLATGDA
jgi:choline kinase